MRIPKLLCFMFCFAVSGCEEVPTIVDVNQKDLCNYFYLDVDTLSIDGKKMTSYSPEANDTKNDAATKFFTRYPQRFSYLLNKELTTLFIEDSSEKYDKRNLFCERITSDNFYSYCKQLLPGRTTKNWYTKNEMMLVASRFFYCDTVLKKGDKISVSSRICVGINGINDLKVGKDLTVLEAFCFEAIMSSFNKRWKPVFAKKFRWYVNEITKNQKAQYKLDEEKFLLQVRAQCFNLMQHDKALEEHLLDYYTEHQNSLRFRIQ